MNVKVSCFTGVHYLIYLNVRPDYAHKRFGDKRSDSILLVVALARECPGAISVCRHAPAGLSH